MGQLGGTKARRASKSKAEADRNCPAPSVAAEITLLMNTLRELAAIRSTAEDAAARILDSAEGLLALADTEEEAKKAQDAILSIMTACGFHDLVGQRVTKITKTLDHVIATRLNSGASRIDVPAARTSQVELDGPGHPGSGANQARIDALFGEKN